MGGKHRITEMLDEIESLKSLLRRAYVDMRVNGGQIECSTQAAIQRKLNVKFISGWRVVQKTSGHYLSKQEKRKYGNDRAIPL